VVPLKIGIAFERHDRASQTGISGEIRPGFRDDDATQHVTRVVSRKMRPCDAYRAVFLLVSRSGTRFAGRIQPPRHTFSHQPGPP
jgi:hypothetical protein